MKLYMTFDPYTLTNMENLTQVDTFNSIHDLIYTAIRKSGDRAAQIYMYDFGKMYQTIANELMNQGYKSISIEETGTEQQKTEKAEGKNNKSGTIEGTLIPGQFITVATENDGTKIRFRRTKNCQIKFINAKKLFGQSTVKDICADVNETEENIGMSIAINNLHAKGFISDTLSSNAFNYMKKVCFGGYKGFEKTFPKLEDEIHDFIMASYQGGLCYCNPKYKGQVIRTGGIAMDVNSMYPAVMLEERLPYGEPVKFEGKFVVPKRGKRVLYFQQVYIEEMSLKAKGVPCVKDHKNDKYFTFVQNVDLVLNHVDLEMLFDNYNVQGIHYIGGYSFLGTRHMFDNYINEFKEEKIKAEKENRPFDKKIAKLMLNSAYGKFATKTDRISIVPKQDEEGNFVYVRQKVKGQESIYAPMGAYITSYARQRLLKAVKANWDRFVYSDTDSIYLKGFGKAKGIEIHKSNFGAWKKEFTWTKMYVVGKKQYVVQKSWFNSKKIKVACAGMPLEVSKDKIINFKDFSIDREPITFDVKTYDRQTGKVVWKQATYKIKDENIQ